MADSYVYKLQHLMKKRYIVALSVLGWTALALLVGLGNSKTEDPEAQEPLKVASPIVDGQKQTEELQRQAHMDSFLLRSDSLFRKKKDERALALLDSALVIAKTEHGRIADQKGTWLLKRKKYDEALTAFAVAQRHNFKPDSIGFKRALCFAKKKNMRAAVDELRKPMALGNMQADNLYQVVNPLKKRVDYYVTRCCDGSSSNAKGRGACSHHGGVCDWNEPQYATYREYE